MTCNEPCRFTLTRDVFLICSNTCDLTEDEHQRTHLCRIHDDLRKKRHFGYQMSEADTDCMEEVTVEEWRKRKRG